MDEVSSFLIEWTVNYIKNKDILVRKIESIEMDRNGFDIIVKYKDRTNFFIIIPLIKDIEELTKRMDKEGHYSQVMLNNKENFEVIVNNWKKLVEFRNLCV